MGLPSPSSGHTTPMLPFLLTLDILLTLFYAVSLPIEVDFRAQADARRGRALISVRFLRVFRIRIPALLFLTDAPSGTLVLKLPGGRERAYPLLRRPKRGGLPWRAFLSYDIDLLRLRYTLGIQNDAVATVFALGALRIVTDIATNFFGLPAETFVQPHFGGNTFEIHAEGMFQVRLVHSISNYLRYKIKERRYIHASR